MRLIDADELIRRYREIDVSKYPNEYAEIIEAAIQDLEDAPTVATMANGKDLIRRGDVMAIIDECAGRDYLTPKARLFSARSEISALPSAEATCATCADRAVCIMADDGNWKACKDYRPSAEYVHGYAEWLEKIIVEEEIVRLCEDTNDKEWCEKNCNYASIQADCLRHLYEVSKGGNSE